MSFYRHSLFALSTATLLAAGVMPSSAQDANAVANRLKSMLATQGTEIGWTSISGSGSNIVLEGTTAKVTGQAETFTVGNVALDGISEDSTGYTIGKVTLPDYKFNESGIDVQLTGAALGNVFLPPEGSTDPLATFLFYETADVQSVKVQSEGKEVFNLDALNFQMTRPTATTPMNFTGGVQKFTADLTGSSDPSFKQMIDALGYQNISGDMKAVGTWQPSDGKLAFTQYDIKVDDAGTLGTTFDFAGYTPALMKQIQDMQKQMAAQPSGDSSAQGMAMLALLGQLSFNSTSIKFTDDSLTNKVLEFVAKQQNATPKDIANMAKGAVPFMLAQLNNPDFSAQVTAAIGAYLDNPQSLTISAKPAAPVPFSNVLAGGMGNPASLIGTLGVSVSAND